MGCGSFDGRKGREGKGREERKGKARSKVFRIGFFFLFCEINQCCIVVIPSASSSVDIFPAHLYIGLEKQSHASSETIYPRSETPAFHSRPSYSPIIHPSPSLLRTRTHWIRPALTDQLARAVTERMARGTDAVTRPGSRPLGGYAAIF